MALKEFYKSNSLPLKKELQAPRLEQLVSKKIRDNESYNKQRTKMKDFIECNNELKKMHNSSFETKNNKLKNFVAKNFLKTSEEKPKRQLGPMFSKATRKILAVKRLLQMHQTDPLRIRRFSLKKNPPTERLLISPNFHAQIFDSHLTLAGRSSCSPPKPTTYYKPGSLMNIQNPFNKKSLVESYLRNKYVSNEKLFNPAASRNKGYLLL